LGREPVETQETAYYMGAEIPLQEGAVTFEKDVPGHDSMLKVAYSRAGRQHVAM